VKDCFDLAGSPTSCGTIFYRDLNGIAQHDSWLVERLRAAAPSSPAKRICIRWPTASPAKIPTSATACSPAIRRSHRRLLQRSSSQRPGRLGHSRHRHRHRRLHPRARRALRLAGYRASHGRGDWRGGAHLAESFDTFGWLFRDLEDGPLLGSIFGATDAANLKMPTEIRRGQRRFLHDCEPDVVANLRNARTNWNLSALTPSTDRSQAGGATRAISSLPSRHPKQRAFIAVITLSSKPSIRQRLEWGASLSDEASLPLATPRHLSRSAWMRCSMSMNCCSCRLRPSQA
jgi:hypothetical protein